LNRRNNWGQEYLHARFPVFSVLFCAKRRKAQGQRLKKKLHDLYEYFLVPCALCHVPFSDQVHGDETVFVIHIRGSSQESVDEVKRIGIQTKKGGEIFSTIPELPAWSFHVVTDG